MGTGRPQTLRGAVHDPTDFRATHDALLGGAAADMVSDGLGAPARSPRSAYEGGAAPPLVWFVARRAAGRAIGWALLIALTFVALFAGATDPTWFLP